MDINKDELLNRAKEELKNEVSNIAFETWIKPLGIQSIHDNHIVFTVTSDFQKDFINTRYRDLISNTFKFITNKEWVFSVVDVSNSDDADEISDDDAQDSTSSTPSASPYEINANRDTLNPRYTFETFVVGENNRLANAAALSVADKPGTTYNPLLLYGGVGLGKTHLMHAIGNRIIRNNRNANVLYVTSEKFTNQLINAIKDGKTEIFHNKYRNIDILLIDDIQFIAGKKSVQEEFFHTFNALYDNGKQIVLSSDRHPTEISLLEDRLRSRFDWGLNADIDAPDYETRLAILRMKAQENNVVISDFILSNIANSISSNIRELEGVFVKIVAIASLTNSPITIELAEKVTNEFKVANEKVISPDFIKETVSKYFDINKDDLASEKRSNDIAFPRQIAMYLCRSVANMSFSQIGREFGNRDHSTVMHAYKKIERDIKQKTNTKLIVESVQNIITKDKE